MAIFSKVKQCVKTGKGKDDGISVCVDVCLPAVNEIKQDKDGNDVVRTVADPKMTAREMFDVLSEFSNEDFLKQQMLSRFIAVVCMDRIRREIVKQIEANPSIMVDDLEQYAQEFVDSGWNVSLNHPETDRKAATQARKEQEAKSILQGMSADELQAYLKSLGHDVKIK